MKFTSEELLDQLGLGVGDKINIEGFCDNPCTIINTHHIRSKDGSILNLYLLLDEDFKVVEDKIWYIDEIENGDVYYYLDQYFNICRDEYGEPYYHRMLIMNGVSFKKRRYADEYWDELLDFNEKYKE
jgi:hypothetical protein